MLRNLLGGLLALAGAGLVGWQAMLVYYLATGRVQAGEEHPPIGVSVALLVVGLLLIAAGYRLSKPPAAN